MNTFAYIISNDGAISANIDGKAYTANKSHAFYDDLIGAIKSGDKQKFISIFDPSIRLNTLHDDVKIEGGILKYKGKKIDYYFARKTLEMAKHGFDIKPMVSFISNAMQNPSNKALSELLQFLEYGKLPITEDGCFLAWKNVDREYKSFHVNLDGTYHINTIGAVISMDRNEVDDDSDNTCSRGLHFCSAEYNKCYGGSNHRRMILKINPKDVVSIPTDYNHTKGRCCEYQVVAEMTGEMHPNISAEPVSFIGVKPSGQAYHNKRDKSGKFCKKGA